MDSNNTLREGLEKLRRWDWAKFKMKPSTNGCWVEWEDIQSLLASLKPAVEKEAELRYCVDALLLWRGPNGEIRDTDGSRKQIELVARAAGRKATSHG